MGIRASSDGRGRFHALVDEEQAVTEAPPAFMMHATMSGDQQQLAVPGGWNTWNTGGYGASSSSGSNAGVFWGNSGTAQSGQQGGQASQEMEWSSSATSSDDGQEYVEVPDVGHLEPSVAAEHVYLMYRKHKRMWRRYTGRPTRTFRRHFRFYKRRAKGYGKGKGSVGRP